MYILLFRHTTIQVEWTTILVAVANQRSCHSGEDLDERPVVICAQAQPFPVIDDTKQPKYDFSRIGRRIEWATRGSAPQREY